MRYTIAVVMLASTTAIHPIEAQVPRATVALDTLSGGILTVRATIGSHGPFELLLDTGSSISAVTEPVAAALGLVPVAWLPVVTPTGTRLQPVVRLLEVSLGDVTGHVDASVVEKARLHVDGRQLDGILGLDFLARRNFTIDYRRRQLTWDDPVTSPPVAPQSGRATRLPLIIQDGRAVVAVPGGDDASRPLVFVADTGASLLVLFAREGRLPLPVFTSARTSGYSSTTARVEVRTATMDTFRVGPLTFFNQTVAIVAQGRDDVDGLLPLHTFKRVSFRPQEGYLLIEP